MFTCSGRAYTIEHASGDKTKHYREMACIGLAITCVHWLGLWLCGKACSAPSASILCILTTGWWKIHLYGINTQIGHLKHSNWHPKTVLAGRSLISFHGDIQPGHIFSHHSSLILVSLDGTYLSLVSICKHTTPSVHLLQIFLPWGISMSVSPQLPKAHIRTVCLLLLMAEILHQLRLVVYPIIFMVYASQVVQDFFHQWQAFNGFRGIWLLSRDVCTKSFIILVQPDLSILDGVLPKLKTYHSPRKIKNEAFQ